MTNVGFGQRIVGEQAFEVFHLCLLVSRELRDRSPKLDE